MVEHLIRKGKTKIIHLTGPSYIQNTFERIKGYKDALSKFNIPFKEEYLVEAGVDFNSGENAVRMLVEKNIPFDAIFCFTESLHWEPRIIFRLPESRYLRMCPLPVCRGQN